MTVVDTDIHHGVKDKKDLLPYRPHVYRERFNDYGLGGAGGVYANNGGQNGKRVDAIGPDDKDAQRYDVDLAYYGYIWMQNWNWVAAKRLVGMPKPMISYWNFREASLAG